MGDVADVLGLEKTSAVDSKVMDPHVVAMTAMSKGGGMRKGKGKKSQPKPPGMSREVMCALLCVYVCVREREREKEREEEGEKSVLLLVDNINLVTLCC